MAKEVYVRTPESNRTIQDDDLKVANILEMPLITSENEDDQRPGSLGMKNGTPHYHNGTEMVPIGIAPNRPLIFTQADLVSDGADGYYLPLNLTGSQITAAVKSTNGFAKAGGDVASVTGFLNNSDQTIYVFVLGEPAPPVALNTVTIVNLSGAAVYYTGPGEVDIPVGINETKVITVSVGQNVQLTTLASDQATDYIVYNEDGSEYYNHTYGGPATINGMAYETGKRQQFSVYGVF